MPFSSCELEVHAQGVANRDVKLENTLLVSSARPLIKLCDFGYSKVQAWHLNGLPSLCSSLATERCLWVHVCLCSCIAAGWQAASRRDIAVCNAAACPCC